MSAELRQQVDDVLRDVEQYLRAETDTAAKLAKSLIALKVARLVVRASGGDDADAGSLAFAAMRGPDGAHEAQAVETLERAGVAVWPALRLVEDRERDAAEEREWEASHE